MSIHEINGSKKQKGTFIVEVTHCEEGTWQGKVTWAESGRKEVFRSALELMKMMDAAMNGEIEEVQNTSAS